jgi:hypothetical protein
MADGASGRRQEAGIQDSSRGRIRHLAARSITVFPINKCLEAGA